MRAILFDGQLKFTRDYPRPSPPSGWALIRVLLAGICRTDLEILRGYGGYRGVLGHEFVGVAETGALAGRRVVGEINAACGECAWCRKDLGRHCPNRSVLGISRLDGCMADYCILPEANLLEVPPDMSDERAVFTEPLSAACEILEQCEFAGDERVVVLGDGRLGILCAWALSTVAKEVILVGRHPAKLVRAEWNGVKTLRDGEPIPGGADVVVEATGRPEGLSRAISLVRPRGRIVLKTTVANPVTLDTALLVVQEITLVGSRCGRFRDGLNLMQKRKDLPLERLITGRFSPEEAHQAFARAAESESLKVLLDFR